MKPLKWTKKFSPQQYEQVAALIEELDLIPSMYVTPTIANLIHAELYIQRAENSLSDVEKEVSKEMSQLTLEHISKRAHSYIDHKHSQYSYRLFDNE